MFRSVSVNSPRKMSVIMCSHSNKTRGHSNIGGVITTSEGVILTKQAIFRRYFARTGTHQHEKSRRTPVLTIKTPCFCSICDFHSYPTDISTRRGIFWRIGIMDLGSKIPRVGIGYTEQNTKECRQDACGTRKESVFLGPNAQFINAG